MKSMYFYKEKRGERSELEGNIVVSRLLLSACFCSTCYY